MSSNKYFPASSDRVAGKLRKYHIQLILLFYLSIAAIIGLTIYGVLYPGTIFYHGFYYQLYLFVAFLYFFYKPPMPHNFKKDDSKELTYQFEEDALVVHFYEKKIKKIPYHSIIGVEALREKLKGIKGVHAVGKHYWLTYGEIVGQSNQYPSLMVYSTSISKGILLQRKFEKILLSPEKEEEFLTELEKRVEVLKTAEV